MASLSADLTQNPPAGIPPPGVIPNYTSPYSQGPIFYYVGSILLFIMIVVFSIRMLVKFGIARRRSWDDLTCSIAALGTTLYFVAVILAVTRGKIGTHNWDIPAAHLGTNDFLIPAYLIDAPATPIWYFTKLTFFLLYLQIFKPFKWFRYCVYAGIGLSTAVYLSFAIAQFYFTTPTPGQTWAQSFQNPRYFNEFQISVPVTSFGLALDIYILILPMAGVSKLHLSSQRKLGVMGIFMTGLGAVVASTISLAYKVKLLQDSNDFMYLSFMTTTGAFVEMSVGVIVSCMPSLSLLAHHPASKSLWIRISRGSSSTDASKNGMLPSVKRDHGYGKSNYVNLTDNQLAKPVRSLRDDVELGQPGRLTTSVAEAPQGKMPPQGGIYTTHLVQQWSEQTEAGV